MPRWIEGLPAGAKWYQKERNEVIVASLWAEPIAARLYITPVENRRQVIWG